MQVRFLDAEVTMQGWVLQGCFCEERPAEVRQCGVAFRLEAPEAEVMSRTGRRSSAGTAGTRSTSSYTFELEKSRQARL